MPNLLTHIQPQLDEMVNDLFFNGHLLEELTKPLKNKLYWWDHEIYRKAKLRADHAELTFIGWLNAVEYLGMNVEAFNASLIESIQSTIEIQWDIRMKEQQEDMTVEIEHELAVA